MRRFYLVWLLLCLCASATLSQDGSSQSQPAPAGTAQTKPSSTPTSADIAAAKASHKVWVNLDTGVYHKGDRWYGKTKNGKFMNVDDAKKAGYKPAKRD
jgi:hypothetical protein